MAKEIIWSPEATEAFERVITYLENNWTESEIAHFIKATEKVIEIISNQPKLYRASKRKKNIHEALITKHNLMLYKNTRSVIYIMTIWDTRQNPKKKKH
jgi:plasmid stabilization system protein ParE